MAPRKYEAFGRRTEAGGTLVEKEHVTAQVFKFIINGGGGGGGGGSHQCGGDQCGGDQCGGYHSGGHHSGGHHGGDHHGGGHYGGGHDGGGHHGGRHHGGGGGFYCDRNQLELVNKVSALEFITKTL